MEPSEPGVWVPVSLPICRTDAFLASLNKPEKALARPDLGHASRGNMGDPCVPS